MTKTITELDSNPTIERTDLLANDKITGETTRTTIGALEDYLVDKFLELGSDEVGSFIMSPNANTDFYLECDGSEYSRGDYPELMAIWEPIYGNQPWFEGSDASTFRVPNHNVAGLFMRGQSPLYNTQGTITQSTTRLPTQPFLADLTHNHVVNPTTATAQDINVNFSIFSPNYFNGGTLVFGGTNMTDIDSFPLTYPPAETQTTGREMIFNESYTPIINSFTPTLEDYTGDVAITGGDPETAPAAFVIKYWVLAKPKLVFAPGSGGGGGGGAVDSVNGQTGDVVLTGNDLANNVSSLNGLSGDIIFGGDDIPYDNTQTPWITSLTLQSALSEAQNINRIGYAYDSRPTALALTTINQEESITISPDSSSSPFVNFSGINTTGSFEILYPGQYSFLLSCNADTGIGFPIVQFFLERKGLLDSTWTIVDSVFSEQGFTRGGFHIALNGSAVISDGNCRIRARLLSPDGISFVSNFASLDNGSIMIAAFRLSVTRL